MQFKSGDGTYRILFDNSKGVESGVAERWFNSTRITEELFEFKAGTHEIRIVMGGK